MSTTLDAPAGTDPRQAPRPRGVSPVWRVFKALASLQLTVGLFALSMVLVFFGTLAQIDKGIWTVVDQYFRSWYVWIPFQLVADFGKIIPAVPVIRFRHGTEGHLVNMVAGYLLNADGTMKSVDQLRTLFAKAGVDPARPVTATCGSGVTAAILVLALARLGNETAAIYDGAWAEWGSRPDAEVVGGPA